MSREIKFRAWHNKHNEYLIGSVASMFRWLEEGWDISIEQYTGLKDKNGVEIYEGDIVAFGEDDITEPKCGMYGELGHVVYDCDSSQYIVTLCKSERSVVLADHLLFGGGGTCRIAIGNIHQNPELLG